MPKADSSKKKGVRENKQKDDDAKNSQKDPGTWNAFNDFCTEVSKEEEERLRQGVKPSYFKYFAMRNWSNVPEIF